VLLRKVIFVRRGGKKERREDKRENAGAGPRELITGQSFETQYYVIYGYSIVTPIP
jgi:hypothetical protein